MKVGRSPPIEERERGREERKRRERERERARKKTAMMRVCDFDTTQW
jgi:hypothetical protein